MGVFFTCSDLGTYENYHASVHLLIVKSYTVKNNLLFQHWKYKRKWIMKLSHDSPELENAFWIIADPSKPTPSSPLRPFQFCQLDLFLFFCLWSRRLAIFARPLSNFELDFFALLVPWPIMIWNLNYSIMFTQLSGKKCVPFPFHNFYGKIVFQHNRLAKNFDSIALSNLLSSYEDFR